MFEVIPDVISNELASAIEQHLTASVEGGEILAYTSSPEFKDLIREAAGEFSSRIGGSYFRVIPKLQKCGTSRDKSSTEFVHIDDTRVRTFALSSNHVYNAGTVALRGTDAGILNCVGNTAALEFSEGDEYSPAVIKDEWSRYDIAVLQAPRLSGLLIPPHQHHVEPPLPANTNRLVFIHV